MLTALVLAAGVISGPVDILGGPPPQPSIRLLDCRRESCAPMTGIGGMAPLNGKSKPIYMVCGRNVTQKEFYRWKTKWEAMGKPMPVPCEALS